MILVYLDLLINPENISARAQIMYSGQAITISVAAPKLGRKRLSVSCHRVKGERGMGTIIFIRFFDKRSLKKVTPPPIVKQSS